MNILEANKQALRGKDLVTELRVFDAYLMELVLKRLGSLDAEYTGIPFIFHAGGWIKGLNRWLSSKSPASITPTRQNLMNVKGIKVEAPKVTVNYDVTENEAVKAPLRS